MMKRRSGEREVFWREQVRRQEASGRSVRQFCHSEGLSEASFFAWRRTLRERDAAVPAFVPVTIAPVAASSSAGITVELRGGRVVRLPQTMAMEQVVALLHGLEASEVMP